MQFTAMGYFVAKIAGTPHVAGLDPRHSRRRARDSGARAVALRRRRRRPTPASPRADRDELVDGVRRTAVRAARHRPAAGHGGARADLGAELGGERLRRTDAPELGADAGRAPIRRQRGGSQIGRVQRAGRDRTRNRRPADRLGRSGRIVLRQRRSDAGGRRRRRDDASAPSTVKHREPMFQAMRQGIAFSPGDPKSSGGSCSRSSSAPFSRARTDS